MAEDFKFKPGDSVCLIADARAMGSGPVYTILERWTQECVGGVQRHYTLRCFATAPVEGTPIVRTAPVDMRVLDFEVCAVPSDEEIEATFKKQDEHNARIRKNRKAAYDAAGLKERYLG